MAKKPSKKILPDDIAMKPLLKGKEKREQQAISKLPEQVDEIRLAHPKVTDKQAAVVEFILTTGATQTQAADFFSCHVSYVSRTVRLPHVVAYSIDLAKASMGVRALQAIAVQEELLQIASPRVRADVASDILNRAGVGAENTRAPGVSISFDLSPSPGGPKDITPAKGTSKK